MFQTFPWRTLLIKFAALLSFCGGPLVVADSLKHHIDKDVAFALAFLPTVALIFGLYSLSHAVHDHWDKAMVAIGAMGAVALAGMNVIGVSELAYGSERADAGLIRVGIAVGSVVIAYYAYASHKFFRAPRIAA